MIFIQSASIGFKPSILAVSLIAATSLVIGCGSESAPDDVSEDVIGQDIADSRQADARTDAVNDVFDGWTGDTADDVPVDVADADGEDVPIVVIPDFFDFATFPTDCVFGNMCEIAFTIDAEPDNPFDPAEISVDIEVAGPGYWYMRPAFYYQGFVDNGGTPGATDGLPEWRVRFQPAMPGQWNIRVFVTTADGRISSNLMALEIGTRAPGSPWHGYVRPSSHDQRYLAFEDGTPYLPIGENMCWWDTDVTDFTGSGDNPGWMKKLADNGGNFIRLWMATWGFSLEWSYPVGSMLGDYRPRMDRAWALDRVFEKADELDQMVMLCMFSHGQFSTVMNPEWAANPYNTANGGFLDDPRDFFTDAEAIRLTRNRLRYIVARWGAEPALLAWELFNEVDLTDTPEDGAQFAFVQHAWHESMAAWLKEIDDPYRHMVTSSISSFGTFWGLDEAIFSLEDIDIAQIHNYGNEVQKFDIVNEVPNLAESYARFGKPVFFAELGVHSAGPVESLAVDPSFIGLHDLIWAPVFAPSAGSGMTWWWDNMIDPKDQYFQFKALANFVDGIDWADEGLAATTVPAAVPDAAGDPNLKGFALVGRSTTLVWIKNTSEKYWEITEAADPAFIEGATLDLSALPAGSWTAQWHDTFGATVYEQEIIPVDNTMTALPVPGFTHDVALRIQIRAL